MFTLPYTKAKRMVNGEIPLVIHGNTHNALREETSWMVKTPGSGDIGMVKVVKVERKPYGEIGEREAILCGEENPKRFFERFEKKFAPAPSTYVWVITIEPLFLTESQKAARILEYKPGGRVLIDKYETRDWIAGAEAAENPESPTPTEEPCPEKP